MYCIWLVGASSKSSCLVITISIIATALLRIPEYPNYIHVKRNFAKLSTLNDLYKISYTVHT